jgi:RNA polymerase sigma-70 factor (ECF subfamily)
VRESDGTSDLDLLRGVARGDRDALGELYDRYCAPLLALGARTLRDRDEAEEVVHDVFLEAWRQAGDYDPERGTVRTWLVLRMRSRCLDRLKAPARQRRASWVDDLLRADEPAMPDPALRSALAALPDEQRGVVLLAYFGGLSSAEIAESLGVPQGTVKSRLAAALSKLRTTLDSTGGRA